MNKKEALSRALQFEPVSPVPVIIRFTVEAEEKYRAYKGGIFDTVYDTNSYSVYSQTNSGWEEIKPGYYRDYFGVVWNKTKDRTLGVTDHPLITNPSLTGFHFPDTGNLPVYEYINANNKAYPSHFHTLSIGFALFERAWSLTGIEPLLMWMLTEPAFIHDLLDRIADYNIDLIHQTASIGGIDCVRFGDDWAGQKGLLMGMDLWLEFIKPRLDRMCVEVKKNGLVAGLHCCGKMETLFPEIIESGVDIFDPFQPEVMDIYAIFNQYHGKIAFMGGLSIQDTLPFGTAQNVKNQTIHLLRTLGKKGGYIFSPSHALTPDIPAKNIDSMLHVIYNQESYIL